MAKIRPAILRKLEQDNCFIIQQTGNEIRLHIDTPCKSVVRQKHVSLRRKLDDLRISLDISNVRMTDIARADHTWASREFVE